ncbi:rhodanese-like domain-containing protein [Daejeonella sp. JGW-45]|uniref:rhodanese-like domain-containing protein n=1 Tax=Daejeonella sp. JGW-45 TaxID=3034148 RepID=UPI0023EC5838|nr:rhodanese-like domain-containing protein [Daejeonella sp. JGW-45]
MKIILSILAVITTFGTFAQQFPNKGLAGTNDPWSKNQLIQPGQLAALINNSKAAKPLIFNIGVVEDIKGAKNMGAASEKENLERFKKALTKLPKTTSIVVYCGCCPFEKCPNIRPAFKALQSSGFTKARLLNLPTNIKTDWINKGYPLAK